MQTPLLQFAFDPHGDGLQGSVACGSENKGIAFMLTSVMKYNGVVLNFISIVNYRTR